METCRATLKLRYWETDFNHQENEGETNVESRGIEFRIYQSIHAVNCYCYFHICRYFIMVQMAQ